MRVKWFELSRLAGRTPAKIAAPRLPQIGLGNCIEAARRVESPGHFKGDALVLDKAMLASGPDGLFVKTHRIGVPLFDTRDLGRHQCVLVAKRRWIIFGPLAQLLPVRRQEPAPLVLLV